MLLAYGGRGELVDVRFTTFVGALWIVGVLMGCGGKDRRELQRALLPVASGKYNVPTENYKGVVQVFGKYNCTGTFVGPRAVLTAHHCVSPSTRPLQIQFESQVHPINQPPLLFGTGAKGDVNDLAVVILDAPLPDLPSTEIYPIGGHVGLGDPVRLVGYGRNETGPTGVRRTGTNVVFALGDYIELNSPYSLPLEMQSRLDLQSSDNRAGAAKGDSGGPLLVERDGKAFVVGVSHGISVENQELLSEYIHLSRPENRQFLKDKNAQFSLEMQGL